MTRNRHFVWGCIFFYFLQALITDASEAQTESGIGPSLPNASAASFYYISRPGELTMQVNIWGAIQKPGRYEIPTSSDLVQLISYAGGPNGDAKLHKVRITRSQKKEGAANREEYYVNLEKLSTTEQTKLELYPGDTIFIDRSSWSTVRDILTVVTTAAIITSAVANVIIAKERIR